MRIIPSIMLSAALTAAGVQAQAAPNEKGEAKLAKEIEGRVAGKPVSCINFRDIRSSRIIDGTAIVYETSGRKIYVNRPTSGASFLRKGDALVTRTSLSQLCNVDIVRLYDTTARFERGSVGLGQFVPYEKVKSAANGG
ncbi:MAG: hypothetical protein QHC67_11785 [Sphingobium sp.]|uniref:hypothetical protein n=1 Tax=Sphingobium sp. TaxID=1912891 RepID=UPI0029AEEB5A|nr:hypothetical protein [Sphingobium sp.]MDX3910488.1 hypothetical protein [Sphingobium sp.]